MQWKDLNASYQTAHLLDTAPDKTITATYEKYLDKYRSLKAKEDRTPDEETAYRILDNALFGQDDTSDEMNTYMADDVPGLEDIGYDRKSAIARLSAKTAIGSPTVAGMKAGAVELGSRTLELAMDVLNLLAIPQSGMSGIAREQVANDSVAGKAGGALRGASVGATLPILKLLDFFNPTDTKLQDVVINATGAPKTDTGAYTPSQVYKDITGEDAGLALGLTMDVLADPLILEGAISKLRSLGQFRNGGQALSRLRKAEEVLRSAKIAKMKELSNVIDPLQRDLEAARQVLSDAEKAKDYARIESATKQVKDLEHQLDKVKEPLVLIEERQGNLKQVTDKLAKELDAAPSEARTKSLRESMESLAKEDSTIEKVIPDASTEVKPSLTEAMERIAKEADRTPTTVNTAKDLLEHPIDSIAKSAEDALHAVNTFGGSPVNPLTLPGQIYSTARKGLGYIPKVFEILPTYRTAKDRQIAEEISKAYERGKQLHGKADELQALTDKIEKLDNEIQQAKKDYTGRVPAAAEDPVKAEASYRKRVADLLEQRDILAKQYNSLADPIYKEVIAEFAGKYPDLTENTIARAIAITDERTVGFVKAAQQRLEELRSSLTTALKNDFIRRNDADIRKTLSDIKESFSTPLLDNEVPNITEAINDVRKQALEAYAAITGTTPADIMQGAVNHKNLNALKLAAEGLNIVADKDFQRLTQTHVDAIRWISDTFDTAAKALRNDKLETLRATVADLLKQAPDNQQLKYLREALDEISQLSHILAEPIMTPAGKFPQGLLHLTNDEKISTFITLSKMELPAPFHRLAGDITSGAAAGSTDALRIPAKVKNVHIIVPTDNGLVIKKFIGKDAINKGEGQFHIPTAPTADAARKKAGYLLPVDAGEARPIGWWIEATPENTKTVEYLEKLNANLYSAEAGLFNSTIGIGKLINKADAIAVKLALSPAATAVWAGFHKLGLPKAYTFTMYHTQNLVGNLLNAFGNEQVRNHPVLFIKALGKWITRTDQAAKAIALLNDGKTIYDLPIELREAYRDFMRMGSEIGSGINRTLKDAVTRSSSEIIEALSKPTVISKGRAFAAKGIDASVEIGAIQDFVFRAAVREVAGSKAAYETLGHMSARTPLEVNTQTFLKFLPWIRYNAHFWLDRLADSPTYSRVWTNIHNQLRKDQQGTFEQGAIDIGNKRVDIGRFNTSGNIADPAEVVTAPVEAIVNKISGSPKGSSMPYTGIITTAINAYQKTAQQLSGKSKPGYKVLKALIALARVVRPVNDVVKAFVDPKLDQDVDAFITEFAKQITGIPIEQQGATVFFVIKALESAPEKSKYRDAIHQLKDKYRDQLKEFRDKSDIYKELSLKERNDRHADKIQDADVEQTPQEALSKDVVSPFFSTPQPKRRKTLTTHSRPRQDDSELIHRSLHYLLGQGAASGELA